MNTTSRTEGARPRLLSLIGPGILIAATRVGAGDLATASFAGSQLGTAILWAAVIGAFLKFVLNEGLARWQLATGSTVLEGAVRHFGRGVAWVFLPYLLLNGRRAWVGESGNRPLTVLVLLAALVSFAALGWSGLGD